jgi:hypothetical protein
MSTDLIAIDDKQRLAAAKKFSEFRKALRESGGWPMMTRGKEPEPIKDSQANVLKAIDVLGLDCSHDIFKNSYIVHGWELGSGLVGDLSDKMIRAFRDYTFRTLGYEPGISAAREGLKRACEQHTFNSVQDYLNGLPRWDGVKRTSTWLTRYAGAEDTPLHREWGRLFLMALCRRAFEPGVKFDHVLSLEGPEGGGKSTLGKILAGATDPAELCKYFSDSTILDKSEKEQLELCQGVWVYELSEMSGASKADQKKLKAFVVRQEDRAREAYAYMKSCQPRSPVFYSTINPDEDGEIPEYLNPGDRRRWWPLAVCVTRASIDFAGLIRDRDQLFAEAMTDAKDDFGIDWRPLVPDPKLKDLARAEQEAREITHPFKEMLAPLFARLIRESERRTRPSDDDNDDFGIGGSDDTEAEYLVTPDKVWVAPSYVYKQLPPGAQTIDGGRAVRRSMAANGWQRQRTRDVRWYVRDRD